MCRFDVTVTAFAERLVLRRAHRRGEPRTDFSRHAHNSPEDNAVLVLDVR